jgi:hypothetical protein
VGHVGRHAEALLLRLLVHLIAVEDLNVARAHEFLVARHGEVLRVTVRQLHIALSCKQQKQQQGAFKAATNLVVALVACDSNGLDAILCDHC